MTLWILLALGAALLIANWAIMRRLPRHRLGVPVDESILEDRNGLGSVDLWRASGYNPQGQRLVRWWLFTLVGWVLVLVARVDDHERLMV